MKVMRKSCDSIGLAISICLLFSPLSQASDWYIQGEVGRSSIEPIGSSNSWSAEDNSNISYTLGIGFHLADSWFSEIKYSDLGEGELVNTDTVLNQEYPSASISYGALSLKIGYSFRSNKRFRPYINGNMNSLFVEGEDEDNFDYAKADDIVFNVGAGFRYQELKGAWFWGVNFDRFSKDASVLSLFLGRGF